MGMHTCREARIASVSLCLCLFLCVCFGVRLCICENVLNVFIAFRCNVTISHKRWSFEVFIETERVNPCVFYGVLEFVSVAKQCLQNIIIVVCVEKKNKKN